MTKQDSGRDEQWGEEPTFLQQRAELLVFTMNQYLETIVKNYPEIMLTPAFALFLESLQVFHFQVGEQEPMLSSRSAFLTNIEELQRMLLQERGG